MFSLGLQEIDSQTLGCATPSDKQNKKLQPTLRISYTLLSEFCDSSISFIPIDFSE